MKNEFQDTMNGDWEVDSMMEFDHYQNIARAAFGDMLYDSDRVNIFELNCMKLNCLCLTRLFFFFCFIESVIL